MRSSNLFLFTAAFAAAACASTPKSGGSESASSSATSSSPNLITADEIAATGVSNAYDAVDRLHRSWFRDPTAPDGSAVTVYMNNQKQDGGKEYLRQVPAPEVATLEYMRGNDAKMRFGDDAKGGAIIVTRK